MFSIIHSCKGLARVLTACAVLFAAMVSGGSQAAVAEGAGPRQVVDLSGGWRFLFGEQPREAVVGADFDDSEWETISVPHSWNRVGEYRLERSEWANDAQGVGWYRLVYEAPAADEGQRQYLDFGAVGNIADVWVNGVHVGQHKGAFSRFRLDVTDAWKPGETNLIAVRADNSRPAVGSSTEHVIPLSGDFFVHGGLYRDVSLITSHEAGIDLLDYGGPGIYADATAISEGRADISVLARLRNASDDVRQLELVATIHDAEGRQVARSTQPVQLQPGTAEVDAELAVDSPRLWDGRRDPYLYSFTVEVWEQGRALDSVTQPLGIRDFHFDADEGFFLNGRHLKLHGVSRHQDRYGKGWALTREDHAEDMALIVEMGANTVRHAHYQHDDAWSDEADRAGMVVWAEVPYVTTPSLSGGKGSPELWANAEQQTRELIRQHYNHPSIMMWSIGNEVDVAKGFGVAGDPPQPLALLEHLRRVVKEEDSHRPTIYADCCEGVGMVKTAGEPLVGATDLVGLNRYFGWYYPQPQAARDRFAAHLDEIHQRYPDLPISISEYGGGGAFTQHSDNVNAGALNFTGRPQPEEYLSFVHEQTWPVIAERDYVFASWVWNMFDFTSNLRKEGDSIDLNTKGLVSYDRKIRKDAFYYYKALWNPEPMIYLTGKRHRERPYAMTDVKAYSNAQKATLTLNGVVVGESDCREGICQWSDVSLQPGANVATVEAVINGQRVADSTTWIGPDPMAGVRIDVGNLAGSVIAGKHFGSDHFVSGGVPQLLNMGGFGGMGGKSRRVTAQHSELYDHWREGEVFSYAIPVPNGLWHVTLHSFAAGVGIATASMAVLANGEAVLPAIEVGVPMSPMEALMAAAARGETPGATGGDKEASLHGQSHGFDVVVSDGVLRLDISAGDGKAAIAAIEAIYRGAAVTDP